MMPEPPRCLEDNRLMLAWYSVPKDEPRLRQAALEYRQMHRACCPVCQENMRVWVERIRREAVTVE